MGDSCMNGGFKNLVHAVKDVTHNDAYCITTYGDSYEEDTINGFLKTLDQQVEWFHKKLQELEVDEVNAIGLSQGNLVIRAYIEKYNKPVIKNFISIHGPMLGVASIPRCSSDQK